MEKNRRFGALSNHGYLAIILTVVTLVMYYVLNTLTPVVLDDCGYTRPGQTFVSVMQGQAHEYMHVNGRFVAHSTVQIVGGIWGKPVFNILNALMTALLVLLVAYVAKDKDAKCASLFSIVCALGCVWLLYPDQYVTMFMIAGSVNYIWATVIILLFLLGYGFITNETRWPVTLSMCLFALVAGSWSEMYSVCLAPAIFLDLVWRRKICSKQRAAYAICFFAGAAIVVLAPGNFARFSTEVDGEAGVPIMTRVVNMLVRLLDSPLLWIWGITLGLAIWRRCRKISSENRYTKILIIAIVFSLAFIAVSGASWPRTFWAVYTFSFILLLHEISWINFPNWLKIMSGILLLTCIAVDFSNERKTLSVQKSAVNSVIEQARGHHDAIYWEGAEPSRKSISDDVLSVEPSLWKNTFFSNYYGLESVRLLPREVVEWAQEDAAVADSGQIVMMENYVLFPVDMADMSRNYVVEVDMGDVYVFKSKIGRLLNAMHLTCGARIYSKDGLPINMMSLYSPARPLVFGVTLSTDEDVAFYMTKGQQKYLAVNKRTFLRYSNIDLSNIKLCLK